MYAFLAETQAVVMAQAAPSADILMELWGLAKGGTPLVVMVLLAWLYREYSERKATQSKYDSMYERYIALASDTNSTLREFRELFSKLINPRGGQ